MSCFADDPRVKDVALALRPFVEAEVGGVAVGQQRAAGSNVRPDKSVDRFLAQVGDNGQANAARARIPAQAGGPATAAGRAHETRRPTVTDEKFGAGDLVGELRLKLGKRSGAAHAASISPSDTKRESTSRGSKRLPGIPGGQPAPTNAPVNAAIATLSSFAIFCTIERVNDTVIADKYYLNPTFTELDLRCAPGNQLR